MILNRYVVFKTHCLNVVIMRSKLILILIVIHEYVFIATHNFDSKA